MRRTLGLAVFECGVVDVDGDGYQTHGPRILCCELTEAARADDGQSLAGFEVARFDGVMSCGGNS